MARYELTGFIGQGPSTASALSAFLAANPGPVELLINSPGGSAAEGAAMLAIVQRHGDVTVRVDGVAASAASLVMVGGRRVIMHPAALVMIHEPAADVFGPAEELRATADALEKMAGVYAAAYARATGNPVERVAAWMAKETWLTAEEAVALNFADEIEGDTPAALVAAFDYTRFTSAPAALVAMVKQNGWATVSPESSKEEHHA